MQKRFLSITMMLYSIVFYGQLTGIGGGTGGSATSEPSGNFLPEVVPPSPEAAALSRFTEVPVSHYTGLPNVSIPIHTISVKGIQVPVNLSYHARGVKVSEVAPRTGTGWSLTYGGDISRQTRGRADDVASSGKFTYFGERGIFMNYSANKRTREVQETREQLDPGYDFYPDQFTFSAGGTSGKFVFDYKDLQPVIQSFGDVDISFERENGASGKISSFKVKDAQGNTFYYGVSKDGLRIARDYQHSIGLSVYYNGRQIRDKEPSATKPYTSWKLMDIETPYGELISYHYKSENITRHTKAYDKHDAYGGFTNSTQYVGDITKINSRISKINSHENQLVKIEYSQGSIVFTKQTNARLDYEGQALDKITINNNHDAVVKAFKLNYRYTTSKDQSNLLEYFKYSSFTKAFKRLFLDNVVEEAYNGLKLPPYKFTYNSIVLPSRYSTRQDYWGYYNGAINNGPFLRMFDYGTYKPDRRVHLEKSKAGLLEQIKYPTGGVTRFTYEHNEGMAPSYIKKIRLPDINPQSVSEVKIKLTKKDFIDPNTGSYKNLSFDIFSDKAKYSVGCIHLRDIDGDPNIPDCIFQFVINGSEATPGGIKEIPVKNKLSVGVIAPRFPGVDPDLHTQDNYDFQITITYQPSSLTLYSGGKRIKKIEYVSEKGNQIKEFKYSSGSIIGFPGYISEGGKVNYIETASGVVYQPTEISHYFDQTSAYSSFQSNSIGYSYVTKYNGTKDNNEGKTEYTFTNFADSGGDYYEFPYHPPTDNEWLRGKNIKTRVFKFNKESKTYGLVKEIYNKYQYSNKLYSVDFDNIALFLDDFEVDPTAGPYDWKNFVFTPDGKEYDWEAIVASDYVKNKTLFRLPLFMKRRSYSTDVADWGYRIYHLTGGTVNLHSTTETNYFEGKKLETQTKYYYDYNKHYQLSNSEMTDSKNDVYKTVNSFDDGLTNQNRMTPVKTEAFKNGTKLSTQYTPYVNKGNLYLPEKVQTSKGTQGLEDRVVYHSYDTKGNPTEVSKKDGTHIVYIWGYHDMQPVAKIEGAALNNIPDAYINAIKTASNLDTDRTQRYAGKEGNLRKQLNKLHQITALKNAQITYFTYDPLVGVTSITDPRGETMYYEYDIFNRLSLIKNAQGHILKQHNYNYKN